MDDNLSDDQTPKEPESWVDRASALVKDMSEQGMEHPSSNNVLVGAALGFMAGLVVFDDLGFIFGAFIGAAIAISLELEKQEN